MSSSITALEALDARHTLRSLPVVVLHVHSRCNCRCTMCDIWQTKETRELTPDRLHDLLPQFRTLGVRWVVLTGGEPLLHRNLSDICGPLRARGIKVTLLTTGLLLASYAARAESLFDEVIVSIDGPPAVHNAIRHTPNGFERISTGLDAVRHHTPDLPLRARVTVQKANHAHLRETIRVAKTLPLDSISFLAADLTSEAFNRKLVWPVSRQTEIALSEPEIRVLEQEIEGVIAESADDIDRHFIAESPAKLRRIARHFRAHQGLERPQAPACNAPWTSAVLELDGTVRPCFFQPAYAHMEGTGLAEALNGDPAFTFRQELDIESNPICRQCVCSLNYRQR